MQKRTILESKLQVHNQRVSDLFQKRSLSEYVLHGSHADALKFVYVLEGIQLLCVLLLNNANLKTAAMKCLKA
jgi:hypothetical protein